MEITTAVSTISITNCPKFLQFHSPLRQFHALVPSSLRFPVISHIRNPRFVTCCRSNEKTSNMVTEVAVEDPSLAVKNAADILPELKGTSIYLVGMASPIKTSLGKLLADSLRYYYFDSDNLVLEAAGGESAAKAFRESDENGYQEAETEVLKQLSSMGRLVVCAGNGAVQSSTNLALLRHGLSIWIDVPLNMVTMGAVEVQSEDSASEVASLYEQMKHGYSTADATLSLQKVANQLGIDNLDGVTIEDMAMEVLKEIEKLTRVKKMMEEAAKPF
ncbi:probable inactive shikimate kinase like 1, chloroplastic isoform X2 [Mangifera indica]|uniref:probable inactive shikimate kinase like 1, chloroplastic isoform X2 n=1 Tax=Mangifera indica TaxID=29780 RepID=UPI001CFAAA52|nr:probable inactive shikimate kinase like 1, chloroplastic isoform X2 [Mangifera indica]